MEKSIIAIGFSWNHPPQPMSLDDIRDFVKFIKCTYYEEQLSKRSMKSKSQKKNTNNLALKPLLHPFHVDVGPGWFLKSFHLWLLASLLRELLSHSN